MTTKNILLFGAVGVALIYFMSGNKQKAVTEVQSVQFGGYNTDPQATETGVYRV
ncbi:MAG: hypothetical protein PHO76_02550 [Methylotenera sp.]|nr:hypothetical protein [Methylotenera sp.]